MADARVVANRLLDLAAADDNGLTPMQVLKLVYISHGWSLGLYNESLIDQPVEAWQYGPVIPDLYRAMSGRGAAAVRGPLPLEWGAHAEELTPRQDALVRQIYQLYRHFDGIQLSRITHARDTPWDRTYTPGSHGVRIPDQVIAEHYRRLSQERRVPASG